MKKNKKGDTLSVIFVLGVIFLSGFLFGRYAFPKKVLYTEELLKCEKLGGKLQKTGVVMEKYISEESILYSPNLSWECWTKSKKLY